MRAKAKGTFLDAMKESSPPPPLASSAAAAAKEAVKEDEWEVRPGGMLVQKRSPDSDAPAAPVPTIRIKVKFNGVYHEIYINSQASFGNATLQGWRCSISVRGFLSFDFRAELAADFE